jgi:hypothetical protein
LVSAALENGDRAAQIAAILTYALVTIILSIPWLAMDLHLARHPELLNSAEDVVWMRAHARASVGTMVGAAIGFGISFFSPLGSLVLYLIIGAAFLLVRLRERAAPVDVGEGHD